MSQRPKVQSIEVPPIAARAFTIHAGGIVRIIDIAGGQPGDLVAFCLRDPAEHFSQARTRVENRTCALATGGLLWSNANPPRVMLSIIADTFGGHDLLYTPCCRWALEKRFGVSRDGCLENLAEALAPWGIAASAIPDPLNLFFSVSVAPSGAIAILPPRSAPGAYIELKAETDCLLAVATCSVPRPTGPNTHYRIEIRHPGSV